MLGDEVTGVGFPSEQGTPWEADPVHHVHERHHDTGDHRGEEIQREDQQRGEGCEGETDLVDMPQPLDLAGACRS